MNDLDVIKEKIRIIDICNRAGLRVNGKGFTHCIYHREKTPSLSIREKDNKFKCFGCGKGGSVIDFYMQLYHLQLYESIMELKALAGITNDVIRAKTGIQRNRNALEMNKNISRIKKCMSNDELYIYYERLGIESDGRSGKLESEISSEFSELSNKAAIRAVQDFRLEKNKQIFFELYNYCLKNFNRDKAFKNYLINDRRLSEYTIEKFDLFYIGNYYQVSNHLMKTFKDMGDLQRSGLFNDDGKLIFYKHKLIIPYKHKNEIVYLRGRYYPVNGELSGAKYLGLRNDELNLNTPKRFFNSDIISKLFTGEKLFITEGEFDAMVLDDLNLHSIGIAGVGNVPSEKWLRKLLQFDINLLTDNDNAGTELSNKLEEVFLKMNKEITIYKLEEKDPTDFVKSLS